VAELGAGPEPAAEEAALRDDGAADAGADGEHRHVGHRAARAETVLGPPGGVGVVVDRDRHADALGDVVLERLVAPVDVGCVVDGRLGGVDEPGCRHSRRDDLLARREPVDHADDEVDDPGRVARRGRLAVLGEDLAGLAHESARDLGSAYVYSDGMHKGRV
jgi:hypothetical protein